MTESDRFQKALLDPPGMFPGPRGVLGDKEFTKAQKIEILRRWEYDASEISAAEGEGMPAGNGEVLREVLLALEQLGVEIDSNRRPPTRQGGLDREALQPARPKD